MHNNCGSKNGGTKTDNSKNEKHGDSGRAQQKVEKRVEELEQQLLTSSGREKTKLQQKIKNINRDAKRKAKGEEHSWTKKQ